jgi:hypothetical protein
MLGYVLATPSNSPFSRLELLRIWMWLSRGRVFFAAVRTVLSHRHSEGA